MKVNWVASLLVVFMLASAAPAAAQFSSSYDDVDASDVLAEEAIAVGPFLFSPALQLTWQRRDNIRFTPDDEITDDVYLARLRLLFELPVYESYIRFSYTPQYRAYKEYDYRNNWGHYFDITGEFEFSNGLELGAAYKFVSTAMETREVDAGGEFMPGEARHNKHFVELYLQYWFSERDALAVEGSFEDLRFPDEDEEDTFFYPYNRTRLGVSWLHQLNPVLTMDLRYRYIDFDSQETFSYRDYISNELTIGFTGQLNERWSSGLHLGYIKTDYSRDEWSPEFSDYSGLLVRGNLTWQMGHGSNLRLDLIRSPYPSNYATNAYYIATGGSLIWDFTRERWYAQARVRLQNNDYEIDDPWFDEQRSDDILTFQAGLGFRFTRFFSLRGTYLYEDRETIYAYSYKTNIITLSLVVGY